PTLAANFRKSPRRQKMRIRGVQMIVGRVGAARRSEPFAKLLRHARRNRRVIFYHVAVTVDDFVFLGIHGVFLLSKCHSEPQAKNLVLDASFVRAQDDPLVTRGPTDKTFASCRTGSRPCLPR